MYKCFSVFPKTDYTYSQTSQCRYEIAPGVLATPNMSRRPIHADCNESVIPQVSHQNLSQISQKETESGISDMVDFKNRNSLIYSVSIYYLKCFPTYKHTHSNFLYF